MDPKFDAVIDFEMYDGFESGLAVFASGEGIRFSSVGDQAGQKSQDLAALKGERPLDSEGRFRKRPRLGVVKLGARNE